MDFGVLIQRLYPFSFRFDAGLSIDHLHRRMKDVFPKSEDGKLISEIFKLKRPQAAPTWDLLTRSHLTSFEFIGRTKPAVLRGAVIALDENSAWFIGTPVFKDLSELKIHGFRLDDFPPFDTSLDAQLALSGTRTALRDAEHLAETLQRMNTTKTEQIESLNEHVVRNAADSGLGRSISSILHDLNGQFGIAVTGAHMVKESLDILNEELSRFDPNIDVIRNALVEVNQMNAIVRQSVLRGLEFIGNYKVISIDQVSLREREVVLTDYLRQIVESMRPMIKQKSIELEVIGDDSVIVRAPGLIAQMVTNLVENGFLHAFNGRKQGRITFRIHRDGDCICLSYEDDGVGMSPEILNHHLDAFYTTKVSEGGSGLGAYSIAVIVRDNLKGTLQVTSELGVGTRYDMRFPIATFTVPQS